MVDKIGRRRMTLFGFGTACTGVLIIGILGFTDFVSSPALGSGLIFGGVLANFGNNFQISTSYAYLTELPQMRFRAMATGWG